MKTLANRILTASASLFLLAADAATVTVTVRDDGVSNIGAPGTFYWALTNCSPGDTIAFNIPGAGPHFLQPPPSGFPLIYRKHRITIDGYTQPGASANSNPITAANNAQIKIVIDGRNNSPGNTHARDMGYGAFDGTLAKSDPPINNTADTVGAGFDTGEMALLGIYRSTNVTIKGLAFLADDMGVVLGTGLAQAIYGIAIAHDYGLDTTKKDALEYADGDSRGCHVAGCWFGVNPTNTSKSGVTMCLNWINFPRHKGDDGPAPAGDATRRPQLPNVGLIVGVAPGAANPRSEFNVFVGGGYHFAGEPLRLRVSGNFVGMMPDGVTPYDMSTENDTSKYVFANFLPQTVEFGRYGENYASSASQGQPMVIGTDGDGVNDADEGNLWGPIGGKVGEASLTAHGPALIHWYRSGNNVFLIAGNTWGIGVDGRRFTNSAFFISGLYLDNSGDGKSKLIIGSDFASTRSAATIAAQANHFYNNWPLDAFGNPPSSLSGIVPFLEYENPGPRSSATTSPEAWISLRGNVLVGNGIGPVNYADGASDLLNGLTNFYTTYLDINAGAIPTLDASKSIYPHLVGTFPPGIAPFTNVTIDVYQLDPEGWTNGQAFTLAELFNPIGGGYNGFAQGRKYLGSFSVPNTGSFDLSLPGLADVGDGRITVTANYSQDPAGTPWARTATSDFSTPIYMYPAGASSVGLTQVVPDVACWYSVSQNGVTNGPIDLNDQPGAATLGNWEPYVGAIGDSTFLIEFNTYANDGLFANQNNAVAKQPAAGGPGKVDYCFYGDNGQPFKGQLNLSRQNGNPGRVAGDLRYGANKFMTMAEASLGQVGAFQTVARWGNNNIYTGNNRYPAEQLFRLNPSTLVQTPVANAWDYLYGAFVGAMGAGNNAPQVGRTGGRPNFLDNGNIVVMWDDRSSILSTDNEVVSFAVIQPDGTPVKAATLASTQDIFDNMCAVKGGFVIRAHGELLFYNNVGTLMFSNHVTSSGMNFGGSADSGGRGDGIRIGGDIRSYYVYVAGTINGGGGAAELGVAAWDTRTGEFAGGAVVTDGDPAAQQCDRTSVAVDALNRVCVVYAYKPDKFTFGYQTAARVAQFDGHNFTWLTHSFFPFVNHDQDPAAVLGYSTVGPVVAMNTRQICIAAKGTINNANDVGAGPNTPNEQTVYTVISHPVPVAPPQPTVTITRAGGNVTLSWNAEDGLFTVQTKSSLSGGNWVNATAENVVPPVTLPIGAGEVYFRLAR